MKKYLKRLIQRIILYVAFGLIYLFFWKISNFETAVIIALGQIIGETHYKNN